jgi:hypothetical protein
MQTEPILTKTSASIQDILGADLGRITVERGDSAGDNATDSKTAPMPGDQESIGAWPTDRRLIYGKRIRRQAHGIEATAI